MFNLAVVLRRKIIILAFVGMTSLNPPFFANFEETVLSYPSSFDKSFAIFGLHSIASTLKVALSTWIFFCCL